MLSLSHTRRITLTSARFILERTWQKGPGKGLAKVQLSSHTCKHIYTHLVPILGDYIAFQTHLHMHAVKLKTNLSQHTQIQAHTHALTHTFNPKA